MKWLIKFTKTLVWAEKGLRFVAIKNIATGEEIHNLSDIPKEVVDFFGIDEYGNADMLKPNDLEKVGVVPNRWTKVNI